MTTIPLPSNTVLIVPDDRPVSLAEHLGIRFGQGFTHEHPDGRTVTWSIDLALEVIGSREPQFEMNIYECVVALQRNGLRGDINLEYAMTTDLSKPLIAVESPFEEPSGDGRKPIILIDGWHRISRFVLENGGRALDGEQVTQTLKCHILTRAEEIKCRVERIQ